MVKSHRIAWTYELETDLLVGLVTPEIAARQIEYRSLGPRLQDVVERFLGELDGKSSSLQSALLLCKDSLGEIAKIPLDYSAERKSRIATACAPANVLLADLQRDCEEFKAYLEKLKARVKAPIGPVQKIAASLPSLENRLKRYNAVAEMAKKDLDKISQQLNPNP